MRILVSSANNGLVEQHVNPTLNRSLCHYEIQLSLSFRVITNDSIAPVAVNKLNLWQWGPDIRWIAPLTVRW